MRENILLIILVVLTLYIGYMQFQIIKQEGQILDLLGEVMMLNNELESLDSRVEIHKRYNDSNVKDVIEINKSTANVLVELIQELKEVGVIKN